MTEPNTTCDNCGMGFYKRPAEKQHTDSDYCCRDCYMEIHKNKTNVVCENCDKNFKVVSSAAGGRKYCSPECSSEDRSNLWAGHKLECHKGYERWNTQQSRPSVHQLVAVSKGCDPYKVYGRNGWNVHHKNGCKIDNRPENIELVTVEENSRDGSKRRNKYTHLDMLEAIKRVSQSTDLSTKEAERVVMGDEDE